MKAMKNITITIIMVLLTSLPGRLSGQEGGQIRDIDANYYNIVQIGSQVWMKENLKVTKLRDGTDIGYYNDIYSEDFGTGNKYTWYDLDSSTYMEEYGAIYNTGSVRSGQLCPAGWHVSTDADWNALEDFLGGDIIAGGELKEAGLAHWESPNTGATNSSGFTALPGGALFYNEVRPPTDP